MVMRNKAASIRLIAGILSILVSGVVSAEPVVEWQKTFGGSSSDWGWSVQQTSDGGYIIAGGTSSFGAGNGDVYLVKTDSAGNLLWQKTFGGSNYDMSKSVQQTTDGGFIIAGYTRSFGAGSYDVYLIKTDSSGNLLWQKTFDGSDWYSHCSVQQTSDSGYIIGSSTTGADDYEDVYLIKTDSSGNSQWQKTFGGNSDDFGHSAQQTSDGGYIIAGYTYSFGAGNADVYLIKTDSSGNSQWQRTFGGSSYDDGWSIRQTSDGGYIIAGGTSSYGAGTDVYLVKTNSSGNLLWEKTFGGSSSDRGWSVQQTTDGGFIIAGYTRSFGAGSYDVYLIKTDSSGNLVWQKTLGGSDWDMGRSAQQTTDGGYIIAGDTYSYGAGGDVYLVKVVLPDLRITDIKPIQTIEDIPLIKDKATMVRVFVELSPESRQELNNVTVELEFEGQKYYETANLIRYEGNLYVVPDDKLGTFKNASDYTKKSLIFDYGLDAFNFEGSFYPTAESSTTIIAKIDPYTGITESVETNNTKQESFNVKSFKCDEYRIRFQRMSENGDRSAFSLLFARDDAKYSEIATKMKVYLIATYPIPSSKVKFTIDYNIRSGVVGSGLYEKIWQQLHNLSGLVKDSTCEKTIFIVPENALGTDGLRINNQVILIEETADISTISHEVGHTYGLNEEYDTDPERDWLWQQCSEYTAALICSAYPLFSNECGGDWDQNAYPNGYVAGDGWDVSGVTGQKPKISLDRDNPRLETYNYFSFMGETKHVYWPYSFIYSPENRSYYWAPSGNALCNSYDILLEKLVNGGSDPEVIFIRGTITETGVEIEPAYRLEGIPDALIPGDFSFEYLSSTGEHLYEVYFEPFYFADIKKNETFALFSFNIPYINGTRRLVLKDKGIERAQIIITDSAPIVTITSINDIGNGNFQVVWGVNDLDSDNLAYRAYYSHDGNTWFPIIVDCNETVNFTFNTVNLPGSNGSLVKIVVTDGINTAETVSSPFTVSNKPPSAFISRPLNGSVFARGSEITFEGWAYDPEEFELDGSSFVWTSNIDGVIGTGISFTTSKLSVGNHTITLNVSDANGLSDSTEIIITVLLPGDFNIDYRVDSTDLAKFSSKWLNTCSDPNWCEGTDLDHSSLVDFIDFSMFAYKWLWTKIVADFDIDDDVDFVDYAVFANHWMEQNCAEPCWCDGTDFDKSGAVDLYDIAIMADHWLESVIP